MARPKKKSASVSHLLVPEEPKTEWQKFLAHFEENIKLYVAGALFVLICVAIGALIRVNMLVKEQEAMTRYAEAALETDATARLEKYQAIGNSAGRWTAEMLYMKGETAVEAGDMETARQTFEKVLSDYGDSTYAAQATDGLAFLAWNEGRLEDAVKEYEKLVGQWPGEFVARRAHYSMGQVMEELKRTEDAIAAYRKQTTVFPESSVARKAEEALQRLEKEFPDLFPDDAAEGEGTVPAEAGAIISGADAAQTGALAVEGPAPAETE